MTLGSWPEQEFLAQLRAVGADAYHDRHPFHQAMHAGTLEPADLRRWVANRYYYQRIIPQKDAAILANCPLREVRRIWRHRLIDHDGEKDGEGGIEAWLRLGEAIGLDRQAVLDERHLLPAVRFAVDAYLNFARQQPWPVAIASSLTELFAPDLMATRQAAFAAHYPWVPSWGFAYFQRRLTQAPRDSGEALDLTLHYCVSREAQEAAVAALRFKCDLLWAMLDAIQAPPATPSGGNRP